ncbi:hypothetical protein [Lactococcus formosensis]|uniref:hypothetical protein n=1 Tax=Lactococcus formosensis TaxID=1281486 RepID=UPI00243569D8|nr:hypothetical protein [Lactococcus formosensis]MDG6124537.1 hypothetical protein [Lactococcus formosensis]
MPKNAPRGPERLGASKNRRMSTAGAVLCCAVLCCAVLCCAVLCCAVLTDYKSSALPRQVFRYL